MILVLATNDIEKLRKFCSESLPKGINLDNNSNIEICKIQTKNALEFYEAKCNENNVNFCYLVSFIYTDSGNIFKRIDSSFDNKEKALNIEI
ncbi:hypothetical protein [Campylobacter sputorum]|uniref:hypothetical protein n=1 Tax=Campylobacter sputorum TaxID=206 RepID=UPI000B774D99|nr:hypothetical protein [Campylobacter sputorum]ASM36109.1 hypothetical protein CSF_0184 [Campylobacter sputorum bv. faecalis CCUG 20703]